MDLRLLKFIDQSFIFLIFLSELSIKPFVCVLPLFEHLLVEFNLFFKKTFFLMSKLIEARVLQCLINLLSPSSIMGLRGEAAALPVHEAIVVH